VREAANPEGDWASPDAPSGARPGAPSPATLSVATTAAAGATATARGDARSDPTVHAPASDASIGDVPLQHLGVLGAGGVLDSAFDLLRFRFRRFVALAAVVVVPVQILDLWVALGSGASRSSFTDTSAQLDLLDLSGASGAAALVIVFLQAVALFLLGMAAGHLVSGWIDGRDDPFGTVLGAVARRAWVAPIVVVVALVVKSAAACFGGVGFFLADALFLAAGPAAGGERLGPFATIGRSVRLARSAFGTALAVSFGGFVITTVLRMSLLLGPAALVLMLGLPDVWITVAQQATSLVLLVTLPLTACIAARVHVDMRCRARGLDLFCRSAARGLLVGGAGVPT